MNYDDAFFNRMLDIIEHKIVPQTRLGVELGSKVFGAALVRRDNFELVLAATNHEAMSPLWHGEVFAIKEFYELQNHPQAADCLMLATHQPCCMCASAIAWAGFPEVWYLFGYEQTGADFNIPHDQKMIREVFGCAAPNPENSYYKMRSLSELAKALKDPAAAQARLAHVGKLYAELSAVYQSGEKVMPLS